MCFISWGDLYRYKMIQTSGLMSMSQRILAGDPNFCDVAAWCSRFFNWRNDISKYWYLFFINIYIYILEISSWYCYFIFSFWFNCCPSPEICQWDPQKRDGFHMANMLSWGATWNPLSPQKSDSQTLLDRGSQITLNFFQAEKIWKNHHQKNHHLDILRDHFHTHIRCGWKLMKIVSQIINDIIA